MAGGLKNWWRDRGFRIAALFRKELLITLKEKSSRMIIVGPIILYVILFGYIATFNLDYVPYAALDSDRTGLSAEFLRRVEASPVFERVETLDNAAQISQAIDSGRAMVVVAVEDGFARKLENGSAGRVQVIIDGRNSTTAQLAAGYLAVIAQEFNEERSGVSSPLVVRYLFNPNNITQWFIMPGLIVMLSMLQVTVLSALSVGREREQGTFEQLLVMPYTTGELLASKAFAPVAVGLFQSTLIFAVDVWWFDIALRGSLLKIYFVLVVFTISVVGLGLAVSAYSRTMQQGLLTAFVCLVPMVLLSGLFTPVENMPDILQILTYIDPLRFALSAVRRIYLADAGWSETMRVLWPTVLMAVVSLPIAYYYFKKRL